MQQVCARAVAIPMRARRGSRHACPYYAFGTCMSCAWAACGLWNSTRASLAVLAHHNSGRCSFACLMQQTSHPHARQTYVHCPAPPRVSRPTILHVAGENCAMRSSSRALKQRERAESAESAASQHAVRVRTSRRCVTGNTQAGPTTPSPVIAVEVGASI
eukprot:5807813-Pleurochrysis_carterae.AAC.2